MANFMDHNPYDSCLLGINEKCDQFCLSSRRSNKFQYGTCDGYVTIELDIFSVVLDATKEEISTGSASASGCGEV